MIQVDLHEAQNHLSNLLERASSGEEIIISKFGRPVARLVPLEFGSAWQGSHATDRLMSAEEFEIGFAENFMDEPDGTVH